MIKHILPLIPPHVQYVEPFFGGGAIFWAKAKSKHEVINDIDNRVINFWEVCSNGTFAKLQKKINNTLYSEYSYNKAREILKKPCKNKNDFAWAFWMINNISFSGDHSFGHDNIGKNTGTFVSKKKLLIPKIKNRLHDVEIFNRDAIDLIKMKNKSNTFIYLDPPYLGADAGHYQNKVEVFNRLIEVLPSLKCKWLLSTYDIPEIKHLYKKYYHKKFKMALHANNKSIANARGYKTEVLIWNYEINQTSLQFTP